MPKIVKNHWKLDKNLTNMSKKIRELIMNDKKCRKMGQNCPVPWKKSLKTSKMGWKIGWWIKSIENWWKITNISWKLCENWVKIKQNYEKNSRKPSKNLVEIWQKRIKSAKIDLISRKITKKWVKIHLKCEKTRWKSSKIR